MGSSASVAVTWATVVPAGGRMGITQSELAQAAVPVDGEIKWLCHSPAGSVCLAQRGERWKWKRRREGGRGEVGLEEGDVDKGGWGAGERRRPFTAQSGCAGVCDSLLSPIATSLSPSTCPSISPLRTPIQFHLSIFHTYHPFSPRRPYPSPHLALLQYLPLSLSQPLLSLSFFFSLLFSQRALCLFSLTGGDLFLISSPTFPLFTFPFSPSQMHYDLLQVRYYAAKSRLHINWNGNVCGMKGQRI